MFKINNVSVYGIIYKIINNVNKKIYIGQTTSEIGFNGRYPFSGKGIERVSKYCEYNKKHGYSYNSHLYNSIIKYGEENFTVIEIFDVAFSKEELNIKEKVYIDYFDCINNGYNKLIGGQTTPINKKYDDVLILNIKKIYATENYTKSEISEMFNNINKKYIYLVLNLKLRIYIGEEYNDLIRNKNAIKHDNIDYEEYERFNNKILENIEREDFLKYNIKLICDIYLSERRSLSKTYDIIKNNYCSYVNKNDIENILLNNKILRKTKRKKSTRKSKK